MGNEDQNSGTTLMEGSPCVKGMPHIRIIEQPIGSLRFRYVSENKSSHGKLKGASNLKKSFPRVKLENYKQISGCKVLVKASLYTNEDIPQPHAHTFSGKTCKEGICEIEFDCNNMAVFKDLSIVHHKKEEVIDACYKKELENFQYVQDQSAASRKTQKELMAKAKKRASQIEHAVRICFEAFTYQNGVAIPVCQKQFSEPIFHKNANKCDSLRIVRISSIEGSAAGNKEVYIWCDKIDKKSIKIRFYEEEDGVIIWEGFGNFNEHSDIWHNVTIVFRTPQYKNPNITQSVKVNLELYRMTDHARSIESVEFWYHPICQDEQQVGRKRKKLHPYISNSSSTSYDDNSSSVDDALSPDSTLSPSNDQTVQSMSADNAVSHRIRENDNHDESLYFLKDFGLSAGELMDSVWNDISPMMTENNPCMPNVDFERQMTRMPGFGRLETDSVIRLEPQSLYSSEEQSFSRPTICNSRKNNSNEPDEDELSDKFSKSLKLTEISHVNAAEDQPISNESLYNFISKGSLKDLTNGLKAVIHLVDQSGNNLLQSIILYQNEKLLFIYILSKLCGNWFASAVNHRNKRNQTPLHLAVIKNCCDVVQFLLKNKADINIVDKDGNSAVHLAAMYGYTACLKKLLVSMPDTLCCNIVNRTNFKGVKPLHYAILSKSLDCIKCLCESGAKVSGCDSRNGRTGIHIAALQDAQVLRFLLTLVSVDEVNRKDFSGFTALHLASASKQLDSVQVLVEANADISLLSGFSDPDSDKEEGDHEERENSYGMTAAELAEGDEQILKILNDAATEKTDVCSTSSSIPIKDNHSTSFLPVPVMNELQKCLDPPNESWKILALYLGFEEDVIQNIGELDSSPVSAIINRYMKEGNNSLEELKNALECVGFEEAHKILEY